ncbi:MAG: hypothetical protein KJ579_06120 [Verrucomicrobia bacterium]|nr:hypothetical protein [Verrucomicrobiota bacterium]
MKMDSSRRHFLKASMAATLATPFAISHEERNLRAQAAPVAPAAAPAGGTGVPCGKLGSASVSRIICGGNLISGYAHSRDLVYVSKLLKAYFTEEKIMETWALCEAQGINTMIFNPSDRRALEIYRKYTARGGKIQFIAQLNATAEARDHVIQEAVDAGATAVLLVGNLGDKWSREGEAGVAQFRDFVVKAQAHEVPCGIAGHELRTPMVCEKAGVAPDFYMKTLHGNNYASAKRPDQTKDVIDNYGHGGDNYWCKDCDETIAFMKDVKKPWIAYKVLAAGGLSPKIGFKHAFQNGADFCVVGMFDFQIEEDASIARQVVQATQSRPRPWMA